MADLEKIDIRVGTILAVEDVPNSDKLVKLSVSFGDHTRTILAGLKQERENRGLDVLVQTKTLPGKQEVMTLVRKGHRENLCLIFPPR